MGIQNNQKSRPNSFYINTSALFALQIANYIFPFLLIPYLSRILGANLYGVTAFGLSIAQIACIVTDYGFNLSATYTISKDRDNKDNINRTITSVYICKIFLLIGVIFLLIIYISSQNKYNDYRVFFYLMFLVVIGQTMQPIWFFQGLEKMINITFYTFLARLIYLLIVLIKVKSPGDYYLVAIANGSSQIVAAMIGIVIILKQGYRFKWPGASFINETLKYSTNFFWSRAAVATYTSCGAFFLGIVSNPLQVAYYSAAEQLYKGMQAMFNPVSQALYPHMAKHKNFRLFYIVLKLAIIVSIIGVIIGITIGPWFIKQLFGPNFNEVYPILIIFLCVFAVTVPSILLGYPFLGALGQNNLANRSVVIAGVIQIFLLASFYLFGLKSAIVVALSILFSETIVLIIRVNWARKLNNGLSR